MTNKKKTQSADKDCKMEKHVITGGSPCKLAPPSVYRDLPKPVTVKKLSAPKAKKKKKNEKDEQKD